MRRGAPRSFLLAAAALSGTAAASPLPFQTGVLAPGELDLQGVAGLSRFGAGQGTTLDAEPRLRIGLPGSFDMALGAPYRYDLELDRGAMHSVLRTELAYRFLDAEARSGVLRGYATFGPSSARRDIGSGSHNLGLIAELALEDWGDPGTTLYLRGALERADRRLPGQPGTGYELATRLSAEAGLGFEAGTGVEPYIGVRGTHGAGPGRSADQQSLALRPGIRFAIGARSEVRFLGHVAAVEHGVEPERAIFVTWTYRHRPASGGADLGEELKGTQRRLDELSQRVWGLEQRLPVPAEPQQPAAPAPAAPEAGGVLVLNHSGVDELTARVVDTVEGLGASVRDARAEPAVARRERSVVRYRKGQGERARAIARELPGYQLLEERAELAGGADIVVLIGFDLERML